MFVNRQSAQIFAILTSLFCALCPPARPGAVARITPRPPLCKCHCQVRSTNCEPRPPCLYCHTPHRECHIYTPLLYILHTSYYYPFQILFPLPFLYHPERMRLTIVSTQWIATQVSRIEAPVPIHHRRRIIPSLILCTPFLRRLLCGSRRIRRLSPFLLREPWLPRW